MWPGPPESQNGLFPQLLPPPFLPRVQGRKLAPASGTWFCSPKAGPEDGAKGGFVVGAILANIQVA